MNIWPDGVPTDGDMPHVALRAVKAATDMLRAADRMKPYMKAMYDQDFEVGIGLHYGEAVIGTISGGREEKLAAIGETVNVASRIESANKEAGTRLLISEALYQQVGQEVEVSDFIRTRLRGTNERITLYEVARLTPEAEAVLTARESRETMRFAGRQWTRLAGQDEIGDGHRRVFELDAFDLIVVRKGETFFAFNNACPHLHLPFFEKRDPDQTGVLRSPGSGREISRDSRLTDDCGLVCRWHGSCGWDGSDRKLFGADASYKPSSSGYSYHWWRSRFFSYGGQYFDANMKPLINTAAGVRALDEMVRTIQYYPPGVLLFESEEPKTLLVKGEVPLLYSWTSTGKRVGNPAESVIVGKAGFGLVPGAEIDGKVIHRPAITPGRGMAVSKYSKKKEVTMKVLEFISTLDQSLKIVMDPKTIMDPWRISHLRSEKFRKAFPDADKYLDAIEASFPYLVPDPVIPAADEYQRKLSFEITEALAKRKSAKEALDTAAKEWDKVTERRGLEKQKAAWGEKLHEMAGLGIEYHADWAAKAK